MWWVHTLLMNCSRKTVASLFSDSSQHSQGKAEGAKEGSWHKDKMQTNWKFTNHLHSEAGRRGWAQERCISICISNCWKWACKVDKHDHTNILWYGFRTSPWEQAQSLRITACAVVTLNSSLASKCLKVYCPLILSTGHQAQLSADTGMLQIKFVFGCWSANPTWTSFKAVLYSKWK